LAWPKRLTTLKTLTCDLKEFFMRTILSLFLAFLFLPSLQSQQPKTQNNTGTIEGVILDLYDRPITDAAVYAYRPTNFRKRFGTKTDGAGRFSLKNLPPDVFVVHAYKESEGYADTFFSFFATDNKRAWQRASVEAGSVSHVGLALGPKCATLKISIRDERGSPVKSGGSLEFTRDDDPERPYSTGVRANEDVLVPPVSFRLVVSQGYQAKTDAQEEYEEWHYEKIENGRKVFSLHPQPGEVIPIQVTLKKKKQKRQ
jgi:hypothetical protein